MRRKYRINKRRTIFAALATLFVLVFVVSVMAVDTGKPDNPIKEHKGTITAEKIKADKGEDSSEFGKNKDVKTDELWKQSPNKSDKLKGDEQDEQAETEDSDLDDSQENDNASDDDGDGETAEETPIPSNNKEASIATDLKNKVITESQLKNDNFKFYAYILHPQKDMSLKVKIRNDKTSLNGKYLTGDGKNYRTKLVTGYNYITLYLKKSSETIYQITYAINYMADSADEDNPERGKHPPLITTNLDGRTKNIKNRNFIFTVSAQSYEEEYLPYDNIRVTFDGKTLKTSPTGSHTYEYDLHFKTPDRGDTEKHTVTVLAWDGKGNSRFKKYEVIYEFVDSGDVIGKATINVDATTLGLGVIASGYQYEIKQDEPASAAVIAALEEYGFTPGYSGSAEVGFYLKSISGGHIASGASIPQTLWKKIKADEITLTGQKSSGRISEFDYTEGSGWMYTINGALYPGRGLSSYYLEDGDTVTLRFTLAYGKDIGGSSSKGLLSSYCGTWINGGFREHHTMDNGSIIKDATCTEEGLWAQKCKIKGCDKEETKSIPPLGHDFRQKEKKNPTESAAGYILYECSRCGETKREELKPLPPKPTEPTKPTKPTEPAKPEEPETTEE